MPDGTDAGDIPGDVTWMSYAELGRSRGISAASAKRLSNRRRWAKRAGNDGTTRVAVPAEEAVPRETDTGDIPGDMSRLLVEANRRADVAVALADRTLTQLAEAHTEVGRLRDRLETTERRATDAEQQAAQLRDAATRADHDRSAAVASADEAVRAAEELRQAEERRRGQGRWGRLRAAWRGS
jgi:hypothetical protein